MISLDVLIPCKALSRGKSRLSPVLSPQEREALCLRFFTLTLRRAHALSRHVAVVSDDPTVRRLAANSGALVLDEAADGLNASLGSANAALAARSGERALLVLPIDLPRAAPAILKVFAGHAGTHGLAIAPDRAGKGTNLLLLGPALRPDFPFAFGPGSFERHLHAADSRGVRAAILRHGHLAFDVDAPSDLEQWRNRRRRASTEL